MKFGSWLRCGAIGLGSLLCIPLALADTPENEFRTLIQINQAVKQLGENPFGENINLYDGSLSFRQVDVELRGDGPTITISRTRGDFDPALIQSISGQAMADWRLEIPHIESLSADINGSEPGTTPHFFFRDDANRCSNFQSAPTISLLISNQYPPAAPQVYGPSAWWHGYKLVVPGIGDQTLLKRDPNNTLSPQMTQSGGGAYTFPIVTTENWQVSCLPQASNGGLGEGFLVVSPDGTKYWMDWLAVQQASLGGVVVAGYPNMTRYMVDLLVSRVVDRFGNTVTYAYNGSGNPTTITASDGRKISFVYNANGFISSVTVQGSSGTARTWSYAYLQSGGYPYSLSGVTLPDGSAWSFNLNGFNEDTDFSHVIPYNPPPSGTSVYNSCSVSINPGPFPTQTGTITHPSGLTGTFVVAPNARGRSYVPYTCDANYTGNGQYHVETPDAYGLDTIVSKKFSGAGIATETWNYTYSSPNQSFSKDCGSGCASAVWTDVVDPASNRTRYIFSNKFDNTEGKLLETDAFTGTASTNSIRTVRNGYASATGGPWPAHFGTSEQININAAQIEAVTPKNMQTITEEGDTYSWQALAYNSYAQPIDIKRYNSIGGQQSIEETTSYLNDSALWVLGLPQTTVNVSTGETEISNSYNSQDLLQSRSRFGEFMMSYNYDSAGQLASFTDGNNHTTSLGNYYRGIPQSISYPDGTSQSLVVNDLGQITSITDPAGYTTQYSYDAIGRISRITYPINDPNGVSWYAKTFTYNYVSSTERGIPAGHWDRTTTVGNAVTTTYFDAKLRPVLSDVSAGTANSDITAAIAYDWAGRTTFASYPASGSPALGDAPISIGTHHDYDALGRETKTSENSELGDLTTITVYLSGAGIQVTDPNNNVTTTHYQVFDEPTYKDAIQVSAPAGVTQSIARDIYGNPTSITQSGTYGTETDSITKTLVYDNYHRLCRTTEPESGSTVMAYDAANNLAWSAQGQTVTDGTCGLGAVSTAAQTVRTYDAMNRVLSITPPGGTQSTVYTYDALGNISAALSGPTAVSGATSWSATRNSRGQITQESLQVSGQNPWTVGYQYDGYGNVSAITYPNSTAVAYAPDALGRATQVGTYANNIAYFPNGQISSFNFGSGATYVAAQNARQLLGNFSYVPGTSTPPLLNEDYSYDKDGNITSVTDNVGGKRTKSFSYDALNRLTGATAANMYGTESYAYDPLNNLRSRMTAGTTLTFNYDGNNHLATVTQGASVTTSYGYDAQGNRNSLSSGGTTTQYLFDAENQLLQIPGLESYAYDASGRRVSKTRSGSSASTYYFYNHAGQLLYQWDTAAGTSTNFMYLGTKLVAGDASAGEANTGSTGVSVLFPPSYSTTGNFTVSWYGISGASSYELQTLVNGVWTDIYTGSANAYGISVSANGVYQYRVRACANGSCGAWSATAQVTVNRQSPPAAPTLAPSLTVNRSDTPLNYTVLWEGVANASSYNLQEQYQGGAWTNVYTNSPNGSWDATNKPVGNYAYQVQACNSTACGPWSPVVNVKVTVDISPIINLLLDGN